MFQVGEAAGILNEYNARLSVEMEDRKKLTTMLKDFQTEQRELLAQAEQRLQVCINFVNFYLFFSMMVNSANKNKIIYYVITHDNLYLITNLSDFFYYSLLSLTQYFELVVTFDIHNKNFVSIFCL